MENGQVKSRGLSQPRIAQRGQPKAIKMSLVLFLGNTLLGRATTGPVALYLSLMIRSSPLRLQMLSASEFSVDSYSRRKQLLLIQKLSCQQLYGRQKSCTSRGAAFSFQVHVLRSDGLQQARPATSGAGCVRLLVICVTGDQRQRHCGFAVDHLFKGCVDFSPRTRFLQRA